MDEDPLTIFGQMNDRSGNPFVGIKLDRIFTVRFNGDKVVFTEDCDEYFNAEMTKLDAIDLLNRCIEFIKHDPPQIKNPGECYGFDSNGNFDTWLVDEEGFRI